MIDEQLIPELVQWREDNGEDFSIDTWVSIEGNIKLAIGYSFLFWPDFIEFDNCVFLKSHFSEDNYRQWTDVEYVKNFAQIEGVINHIHIMDLFSSQKQDEITEHQVRFLGQKLRRIYEVKLKDEFPERTFLVLFNEDEQTDDLLDYELTFYQPINIERATKFGLE